ncbi:MAG: CHAT domain-containing protein [Anaerolineae bacterium]|nr:CHAT domain-containing protein [Anaerolineae bacterium]
MGQHPSAAAYLAEAERLFHGRLSPESLPHLAAQLPLLDRPLLDHLADYADQLALTQPKHGWAVTAVAEAAAAYTPDLFLHGLAAWYIARAANAWVRPQLVEAAIARARTAFAQLDEPGWLAACDWQQNALPWTRPNFQDAAATLSDALHSLETAGFDHLLPDCRLSLAYAYLLIGQFEETAAQIAQAEQTFQERNDRLSLARCLFIKGSYLRRQTYFEAARDCFAAALTLFAEQDAPIQVAITTLQLGLISWWWQHDLRTAESNLHQAARQFEAYDLPLWLAQCHFGLGQIYQQTGQLTDADKTLRTARETFAHFRLPGLWADSLLDSGWLALYHGHYQTSLDYFRQAESLYEEVGNRWLPAVAAMHQGEAYLQMGWYQRALQYLENAHGRLLELAMPQRIAACEMRLAQLHLQLSQYDQAHLYLNEAETHYHQCGQADAFPVVYNLRAELLFQERKEAEAITILQKALSVAGQQEDAMQIARAQRLLGQALCAVGCMDEAYPYLQAAHDVFTGMGMVVEQAVCQTAWGHYHQQMGNIPAARSAWESALALSHEVIPDISWQARAGLASLSLEIKEAESALLHYREMVKALANLRQGLWQPSLAGSFLTRPSPHLDTAVRLAAQQPAHTEIAFADTLFFIEAGKAQTTARQLVADNWQPVVKSQNSELAELAAEINWLQEKLRTGPTTGSFVLDRNGLHQQLVQKVKAYDRLKSRLERQHQGSAMPGEITADFNQQQFRRQANQKLGQNWMALNYYLAGEELVGTMLTPTMRRVWSTAVTGPIHLALRAATRSGESAGAFTERALNRLGSWLLPGWLQEKLTPETVVIISPHRQLHRLPWPILRLEDKPLVTACIPTIVPSLLGLAGLWQRPSPLSPGQNTGLLLAISAFPGRYPALPAVAEEADALTSLLGANGHSLRNNMATWPHLQTLAGTAGLAARFTFWHVASHAFYDGLSGQFSGVALSDRDIWLDEIRQCGPLPPLVTLSACSGGHSLVYAGDEHVSLTNTCLAAGAQSVISSLWPVRDEAIPDLMQSFYHYYAQANMRPAQALALAQRDAYHAGHSPALWGGWQCFGLP